MWELEALAVFKDQTWFTFTEEERKRAQSLRVAGC